MSMPDTKKRVKESLEGPLVAGSGYTCLRNPCLTSDRFGARSGPIHHSITYSWSRPEADIPINNLPSCRC